MLLFSRPHWCRFFDSQGLKLKSLIIKWIRRFFLGRCFFQRIIFTRGRKTNILYEIFQYFIFKIKIFSTVKRHKIEGNVLIAFTNAFDTEQTINTIKYDLISSADQNQCEKRKTNFCILCNRTRVMRGKSKNFHEMMLTCERTWKLWNNANEVH